MRLWHEELIKKLPRQQLLGQHRECCALRGNGWKRKHSTVDYVFKHDYYKLFLYRLLIIEEMKKRGYRVDSNWENAKYRGKICQEFIEVNILNPTKPIYSEHNDDYLIECINNLKAKGIFI